MADLRDEGKLKTPPIGFLLRRRLRRVPRRWVSILPHVKPVLPTSKFRISTSHNRSWRARRREFTLPAPVRAMLAHARLRRQDWFKRISTRAPFTGRAWFGLNRGPDSHGFDQPQRDAQNRAARSHSEGDTSGVPASLVPFLEVLAKMLAEAALGDPRLESVRGS
jgi:hypothetical protein